MSHFDFGKWRQGAGLCVVAALSAAAIHAIGSQRALPSPGNAAYNLTCEGLERPIAVNTLLPRFSWLIPTDWKGQSAYELQIGTDSLSLTNGGDCDLWSTGKVASTESVNVEYAGDALVPGIQAYWRVKVWDENGSEAEWSEVSRFGVGYVDGNAMPGEYIGMGKGSSGKAPAKYLMIPNRVYTAIANHRYNTPRYLDGIDYAVNYLGYSTVDKIYWDSDNIDRVEVHFNVKAADDAVAGKDYRLEILSGDEDQSYFKYVGNGVIFSDATFNYSVNSDNRLFENGTFASGDAGRYTPAGAYRDGDEAVYTADNIKDLGPSVRNVFDGSFGPITISASGAVDRIMADGDADGPVEYYDLNGRRVSNPSNGMYIRRSGKKTDKVFIR